VSHSAAKTARRKLIEIGWLVPDVSLRQLQLNRAGVRDSISLDWEEGANSASRGANGASRGANGASRGANPASPNNEKEERKIKTAAHHSQKADSVDVPQLRSNGRSKTSFKYEISHTITGTFDEEAPSQEKRSPFGGSTKPGRLHAIERADLWEPKRLQKLYLEAVERQWIGSGERDRLRFFAHAVCARTGARDPENPGPLFVFNLRNSREASVRDSPRDHPPARYCAISPVSHRPP